MTAVEVATDREPAPAGHGGRRWISVVLALLLVAGAVGVAVWFLRPDALAGPGNGVGERLRPGEVALIGTWIRPNRDIELVSIRPIKPPPYSSPGFLVTYRDGIRRGTEKSGTAFTIRAVGAAAPPG